MGPEFLSSLVSRAIHRVENRASFHRHFLSTYCVPAPSTHDCTLERRAPGCGQRGGHSCGGVTPLWEQDAGLPRAGAVRTVLASGQGSAECETGKACGRRHGGGDGGTAGALTWVSRRRGRRRRPSKSWRQRRKRRRPLVEKRRKNTLRPLEGWLSARC